MSKDFTITEAEMPLILNSVSIRGNNFISDFFDAVKAENNTRVAEPEDTAPQSEENI